MGIIVRQGIINSIVSYAGVALGFVLTIWMYPKILSPDQYGLTRIITSFAFVATQFAALGSFSAVLRFIPRFINPTNGHNGALVFAIIPPITGLFLTLIATWFLSDWIIGFYIDKSSLFATYFRWIFPLLIASLLFETINAYARALMDTVFSGFLTDVLIRILAMVLLTLFSFEFIEFPAFVAGFVGIYVFRLLLMLIYVGFTIPWSFKPVQFVGKPTFKEVATFSGFSFLSGFSVFIVNHIDVLMIGSFVGLAATAVYSVAFYITSVITVPQMALQRIAVPILAKSFDAGDYVAIEDLYKRSALNQAIVGGFIFFLIWTFIDVLFVFLPEAYQGGKWVVLIVGTARWFDMMTGLNGGIIVNSPFFRFDLWANLFLMILTVFTNYVFIPRFGLIGAGMATGITIVLFNLSRVIFVKHKMALSPISPNLIKALSIILAFLILTQIKQFFFQEIGFSIISGLILSAVLAFIIYYQKLSPDLNLVALNVWNRTKNRFI